MIGHFPLRLAMICANCDSLFAMQVACPACASTAIYPVEKFLSRRAPARLRTVKGATR